MKRTWKYLLIVVVLLLVRCTSDSDVEQEGSSEARDTEAPAGGDLALGLPSDAISMDPHGSNDIPSEQVRAVIYEPLVAQDENLDIYGKLAEDWEQIDDNTWRFNLREGVTFHDGSTFNAEAVKANLERLQDPAKASPRLFLLEMIEEINIVDDYTVEIVTEYPFSPLLAHLAHGAGKMISKELIDEDYQNSLDTAGENMSVEEYYELRETGGEAFEEVANAISGDVGTLIET